MEEKHYLFGMRPVTEAVRAGRKFEKILFKQGLEGVQFRQLLETIQEKEIPYQFIPGEKMNYMVHGAHQGVIAYISQIDYIPFEEVVEMAMSRCENPLFLMLDGVSDVRNFGAIARSAECAGVSGLILPAKGGAAINADALKTSAGALLRIPTSRVTNLKIPLFYMLEAGFQIVAATEKGSTSIYDVNFKKPTVIVLGSEEKGISNAVLSLCTVEAKIPMMGEIGSLNVSVAGAIVMYEAVRQRV
ncbi:MAG: 23S rRNA (guanosine(2251)-2'-O)-methyltransferase RlmB [Bacteroidales bacterium]|nr:23S rRNA (guanosine(2251)-2'-O)-methyltransferase RlmB [Bacteroidales bacterium]